MVLSESRNGRKEPRERPSSAYVGVGVRLLPEKILSFPCGPASIRIQSERVQSLVGAHRAL